MKISSKINLAFLFILFLPLVGAVSFSLVYYTHKIELEARAKLEANRQTAELIVESRLEEMRTLVLAYASDSALRFLATYPEALKAKLDQQLAQIAQHHNIDHTSMVWQSDHDLTAQITYNAGELSVMAHAPVYDRNGKHISTLRISQSLTNTGILQRIRKQTGLADVAITETAALASHLTVSFPLNSSQGYPLAYLVLQRDPHDFLAMRQMVITVFLGIGLGGLLLIIFLKRFIKHNIVRPIHQLHKATKMIKAGNFALPTFIKGRDEVEALTRSFCTMAASLQKNFRQYQELLEQVTHGIGILQKEKFVFVNSAFLQLIGRKKEDILDATIEVIFKQGHIPKEWEIKKDRWFSCQWSAIIWHSEPAKLLTVQNITEQKRHDSEMKREHQYLQAENIRLRNLVEQRHSFGSIIGKSLIMQKIYEKIPSVAASDATVLLQGETGTGKGLLARTLHIHSPRKDSPFILVNCGAIPENLFEREFFGHVKGAFTGATGNQGGFLDAAQNGTLFLDEIGELPISIQVKLLHILDGDGFAPVGSSAKIYPDVRIITATNQHLEALIEQRELREDFFYRINILPITTPPLRERREDIPLLTEHFWQDRNGAETHFPQRLQGDFLKHPWPGNIRELKNTILRLQTLDTTLFDQGFQRLHTLLSHSSLQKSLNTYEKSLITMALSEAEGHRERAANLLGVNERTLYRKLKKFGIAQPTM